ncbi:MAG TPA: sulfatase-like hydrolase/transferase [Thermoanaerobaculia bacterium]|nr:sulfatase-like hydrolase/transferase [Thermoanaerobaculia bacterium]
MLVVLAILSIAGCTRENSKPPTPTRHPSVFLISIDTLRADHLPLYGYRAVETPSIDAFRKDAILYQNAYSQVPLTLPSHVSILTGLLPAEEGVRDNLGYHFDTHKHPAISSLLRDSGYQTAAAVSAYVLRGETGLRDAFDFYDDKMTADDATNAGQIQRDGDLTRATLESWLSTPRISPVFALLHLFEPHTPYEPPEPYRSRYALPYDGEIARADAIVGRFLDFLKTKGLYDDSLIIVLSDHGEGLGQHGEDEHGIFLYREDIHVPLLIKLPGSKRRGETVSEVVALTGVAPTIAEVAGLAAARFAGYSLLAPGHATHDPVFSETLYPRIHLGWSDLRSAIDARYHLIEAPRPELFEPSSDPGETKNVLSDRRREYSALRAFLDKSPRQLTAPAEVSPEEAAKLTALGYLGSNRGALSEGPLPDPKDGIRSLKPLQEAARLEAEEKLDDALMKYRQVVRENPRFADAWLSLARVASRKSRWPEAEDAYFKSIQASPSLASTVAIELARVLLNEKKFDAAEKNAELAASTNASAGHELLARIAIARGDPRRAESEARIAINDPRTSGPASITLAEALATQQRIPEAIEVLENASRTSLQNGSPAPGLDVTRGNLLLLVGRREEAAAAFKSEIVRFPHDLQAYVNLATLQLRSGLSQRGQNTIAMMRAANPGAESERVARKLLGR